MSNDWINDALDSFDFIAEDQNRKDLKKVVKNMRLKYTLKE